MMIVIDSAKVQSILYLCYFKSLFYDCTWKYYLVNLWRNHHRHRIFYQQHFVNDHHNRYSFRDTNPETCITCTLAFWQNYRSKRAKLWLPFCFNEYSLDTAWWNMDLPVTCALWIIILYHNYRYPFR